MSRALDEKYFEWLCHLVDNGPYFNDQNFHELLSFLHSIDFYYLILMDANRAGDGINLRYHFKYQNRIGDDNDILKGRRCSVLEMMVGLSVRCENQIMYDPDYGDRTGHWFWNMIKNLDLDHMDDDHFDITYTEAVVNRFLERQYEPNGKGGLFTVERKGYDMRNVEIWYQMNWYLNSIL